MDTVLDETAGALVTVAMAGLLFVAGVGAIFVNWLCEQRDDPWRLHGPHD